MAYSLKLGESYEFKTSNFYFHYSSLSTPDTIYKYNVKKQKRSIEKKTKIPSGHCPENYKTEKVLALAPDGESVPVSLIYRKDTKINGTAPLLLYGYGSYGVSVPSGFSASRLSLIDRGFVFAIAHVRGGMEKGYRWYKTGRRNLKKNTFSDFIAVAEFLVNKKYTAEGLIVGHGGSAGGMLVAACMNMRPEIFGAIIAEVPFVDVLNTMSDPELPLTPPEWPEWGNPILDKDVFKYIHSYSPYDQIGRRAYPAVFVTAGLTDPRVTYWEPAKWVAKLRQFKTDKNLIILRTNMSAGHGGEAGRFDRLEEVSASYAFVISVINKETGF